MSNDEGVDATRAFDLVAVTEGYFDALGARLVEGRLFTQADTMPGAATCVLSEAAVKHLALVLDTATGRTINLPLPTVSEEEVRPRIVGAIEDIRYAGLSAPAHGGVYVPWQQMPPRAAYLVVRTTAEPDILARSLMQIVREADPSRPVPQPRTLEALVDEVLGPRAARFGLLGVFASGATLLGIVGLSGALIRSVVERHRELAIRAAIGASPRRLLLDVMRGGLLLSVLGIVIGLGLSAMLAQATSAIITGVGPRDPITYGLTAAAVLVVALAACYLPVRRGAATNTVVLLRTE